MAMRCVMLLSSISKAFPFNLLMCRELDDCGVAACVDDETDDEAEGTTPNPTSSWHRGARFSGATGTVPSGTGPACLSPPVLPSVVGTMDGRIDGRLGRDRLGCVGSLGASETVGLAGGLAGCEDCEDCEDDAGGAVILGAGTAFKASRFDCSAMSSSSLLTSQEVPIATQVHILDCVTEWPRRWGLPGETARARARAQARALVQARAPLVWRLL